MKNNSFGEKVINFNKSLKFNLDLPFQYKVLNPFTDNPETIQVMKQFYNRFYADNKKRKFLIGINPSRHGAGITGVPFTDTKRLEKVCGIQMLSAYSHEVSSVFVYDFIAAYGGPFRFYNDFYINSPFPLAIVQYKNGKWVNANYYDNNILFEKLKPYMIASLKQHISFGLHTEIVYSLGKKNAAYLQKLNQSEKLFGKIIALEHPRYIQQYKSKEKQLYIDKYVQILADAQFI
ncbi:MAG: SMUG2 DNA glycosylase family protein [Flavobacteriaceae bacterium]|nr:SMUG2 DNA glycosylase family protein [Flavobacteriaceae bacterium]